ncbi:DUF370 domain-containing protein [bacterium]|nr:DUF370 domain-containing protein [bacterium]
MSFHLGNDFFISSRQLIAILNVRQLKSSSSLLKMLDAKRGSDRLRVVGQGQYRSAVLTSKNICYLSPIDAKTLAKRLKKSF